MENGGGDDGGEDGGSDDDSDGVCLFSFHLNKMLRFVRNFFKEI